MSTVTREFETEKVLQVFPCLLASDFHMCWRCCKNDSHPRQETLFAPDEKSKAQRKPFVGWIRISQGIYLFSIVTSLFTPLHTGIQNGKLFRCKCVQVHMRSRSSNHLVDRGSTSTGTDTVRRWWHLH